MPKKRVPRTRCNNQWTEAKYNAFIKNALRAAMMRWGPKHSIKSKARVKRGVYLCALCKQEVPSSILLKGKRVNNIKVDHIEPIVDPKKGFTSWDDVVARMFVEEKGLQVLCKECHDIKTKEERIIRNSNNNKNKETK